MNKIINALILVILSFPAWAAKPIFFDTIQEAEKYCPATNNLVFHFIKGPMFNPLGIISGEHKGIPFTATRKTYVPDTLYGNSIGKIDFIQVNGSFGSLVNNKITCHYVYPARTVNIPQIFVTLEGTT
jgi:hypothetical protein